MVLLMQVILNNTFFMPPSKLTLVRPFAGLAAMAAMYIGAYHVSQTIETGPDLQPSFAPSSSGSNPGLEQVKHEPTPVAAEGGSLPQNDPLQSQLAPETVRRNSSRWSRSLAALGDDFSPDGSTNNPGQPVATATE